MAARRAASGYTGVQIRETGSVRVRVPFGGGWVWEGVEYPSTAAGLKQAARHRQEVLDRCRIDVIDWCEWFPKSSRCRRVEKEPEEQEPTLREAVELYLRLASSHLADSTLKRYRRHLRNTWCTEIGSRPVSRIRQSDLIDVMQRRGWNNGSTQEKALAPLRSVLEQVRRDGWTRVNAAEGIKTLRHQKPAADPLGWSEVVAVLAALRDTDWWPYFAVSLATGARPSELAALRWSDVSLSDGTIRIERGIVDGREGPTKTAVARVVLILPLARAGLELQAGVSGGEVGGRVFPHPLTGATMHDEQPARRAWRRALKAAGVRHRKPYVTRHTFATRLIMSGTHFAKVSKWLGHKSAAMTLGAYTRWIDGEPVEALSPDQAWRVPGENEHGPDVVRDAIGSASEPQNA